MRRYLKIISKYYSILGIHGIISLVKSKFSKNHLLHKVTREDLRAPFYLRIRSTDIDTYKDVFLNEEYRIHFSENPKIIIDAGGNIGLTAIYFANRYPKAKIFTIEPENNNFKLLKKNTSSYDQIYPIHTALWHEIMEVSIQDSGEGEWAYYISDETDITFKRAKSIQKLASITIDQLMNDYSLNSIDLLKIDIEGAEKEIFENSSSWIHKVNCIIVEIHEHLKPGCLRSFYNGSNGFDYEWHNGNIYYLSRKECNRS